MQEIVRNTLLQNQKEEDMQKDQQAKLQLQNQNLERVDNSDNEEELNSNDDVIEHEENIEAGRNILLAFYKKVRAEARS